MRHVTLVMIVCARAGLIAQQAPHPRQQPGASITLVAPGWDHLDNGAGEVNPATQQMDFCSRGPQQNPKNKPDREVFLHFFGMEITWT